MCSILIDDYLYSELLHYEAGVSFAEDVVVVVAFTALEVGHVLYDSEDSYSEILEHLDAFDNVDEGESLWGCDDDCSVEFQLLAKTELDVSCSWRHIYD